MMSLTQIDRMMDATVTPDEKQSLRVSLIQIRREELAGKQFTDREVHTRYLREVFGMSPAEADACYDGYMASGEAMPAQLRKMLD